MKKKILILMTAVVVVLAAVGCTQGSAQDNTQESTNPASEVSTSEEIPNPWSSADSAEAAAQGAGVGYFDVPENKEYGNTVIYITEFYYMTEVAEARGSAGSAELTIRKGLKQNTQDVSGDYNTYKYSWTFDVDGFTINCSGNEEGKTMKAIWVSDNFSYSINIMGQGDDSETFGLDDETMKLIIADTQ